MSDKRLIEAIKKELEIDREGTIWLDTYMSKKAFTEIAPTITTTINSNNSTFIMERERTIEPINAYPDDTARTIKAQYHQTSKANFTRQDGLGATGAGGFINGKYRIRKLTPKECFRLMGVTDEEIAKIENAGISRTQQYKMAGNSIVVDTLSAIFDRLLVHTEITEWKLFY